MTETKGASAASTRKVLVDAAKTSPTTVFSDPAKIVTADRLTKKEKAGILEQWESDAISLQTASDEGMSGGSPSRLDEVKSAQTQLGAKSATISAVASTLTVINTFGVTAEKADVLIAELVQAAKGVMRQRRGFISASIHKSMDGMRVVNYAQWACKTDFDNMIEDPEVKAHMAICEALAKSVEPVIYDVVFAE
jgi:heme-degrading monooxygenase HmoA